MPLLRRARDRTRPNAYARSWPADVVAHAYYRRAWLGQMINTDAAFYVYLPVLVFLIVGAVLVDAVLPSWRLLAPIAAVVVTRSARHANATARALTASAFPTLCATCGYDLRGQRADGETSTEAQPRPCPECGARSLSTRL